MCKGLILNSSIHAAVRAPVMRAKEDVANDHRCGFSIITARDIDLIGAQGVIDSLKKRVGNNQVYISLDIDSLDPAFAPGK
jgi:guanidinobutyrase / D-arginase